MAKFRVIFPFLVSLSLILTRGVYAETSFTLVNHCTYPIWPGLFTYFGTFQPPVTGLSLETSEAKIIFVPTSWSGYLWARTFCSLDDVTSIFTCATADCGSGKLECAGSGAPPPASLAEFTLNGKGGLDYYDVSLVGGFNVPITVEPKGGKLGNCTTAGCATDLNDECPKELEVVGASGTVACKSACDAFGDPIFCCKGDNATPGTCNSTMYSEYFKRGRPLAYSYAHDDVTSTFTCGGASEYVITFCHTSTTSGNPSAGKQVPADPKIGSTTDSTVSMTLITRINIFCLLSSYMFLLCIIG